MKFIKKPRKKKLFIILLILCLIFNSSFILFKSNLILIANAGSGDPPINGTSINTWYVDGYIKRDYEWINTTDIQINNSSSMKWRNVRAQIDGNIIIKNNSYFNLTNCRITLNDDITIQDNGTIILKNSKIWIKNEKKIEVESGGSLYIYNSKLNGTTLSSYYKFITHGKLRVDNSFINQTWGPDFGHMWESGIQIYSNDVIISNSTIANGKETGIGLEDGSLIFINSKLINNNGQGLIANGNCFFRIENSTFKKNYMPWHKDLFFYGTCKGLIKNSNINDAKFWSQSEMNISNTRFRYAMVEESSNITFNNCSGKGIGVYDYSRAILINSIFNNTVFNSNYSVLEVNWFLHVRVKDTLDNPFLNANIIIKDNYGNLIANRKTNKNGVIKWNCCLGYIQNKTYTNYSMNDYNITTYINSYSQTKFIKITSTKWVNFIYNFSPVWSEIPDVHIDEDTNLLNWIDLNDYMADLDTPIQNLEYTIKHQTNKSKINVSISENDMINIMPLIENYYGSSTVTIRASDGTYYSDIEFTVYIDPINDYPYIKNEDITTINEDEFYASAYTAIDVDMNDDLIWTYESNAKWLNWGIKNITLYGTPRNNDVGNYWVRINVSDNNGGYDEHNYTLIVINTNDHPVLNSIDTTKINEDMYYEVIYTATDVDLEDKLFWKYNSNANWLNWDSNNHTLFGIPRNEDVGEYWVEINVTDENGGFAITNFILEVININDDPEINNSISDFPIKEDHYNYRIKLYDWFKDIDNKYLLFRYDGNKNIDVKILKNCTIELLPKPNWNGEETITFYAYDSISEISDSITITVLPVNDAPKKPVIMLAEMIYYEGKYQPAFGNATDVDIPYDDELTFSWFSNISGFIGKGQKINLSLSAGFHKITLEVTDKEGANVSISTERELMKIIPPLIDTDNDGYYDDIDAFPNDLTQWLDSDGDNYGDNTNGSNPDYYPNDPEKWEKDKDKNEQSQKDTNIWLIVSAVVIIIIIVVILLFFLLIKPKRKGVIEQEPQPAATTEGKIQQQLTQQIKQPEQKSCTTCGLSLKYYSQNNKYYCNFCKKYD